MTIPVRMLHVFVVVAAIAASGCSFNNVLEIDATDGGPTTFDGIEDLYGSTNTVNVLFIHGMGYFPIDEELSKNGATRKYQDRLAKELGLQLSSEAGTPEALMLRNSQIVGGFLSWRRFEDNRGRAANFFTLSWDKVTEVIQKTVLELDENFYETGGSTLEDRERDRALLNRALKRFVNRSFADPAIYLGSFGDDIRHIVAQGLEKMDAILANEKRSSYATSVGTNPIVYISDSLGSSVIFDTIDESNASTDSTYSLFEYRTAIQRVAGHSRLIFMNANQLPLIELGRIEGPTAQDDEHKWLDRYPCHESSSLGGLRAFSDVRKSYLGERGLERAVPELQIVAFTDPNDALSYYLTRRFKQHCGETGTKIINVLLTNARVNYLFVLAHPGKAHAAGFKDNDTAIELVVHGAGD